MPEAPTITDIRKLYDEQAEAYATQATSFYSWQYIEEPAWKRHFKGVDWSELKVLDLACGDGRIIEYLLSQGVKPKNLTGLDLSEKMLEIGKRKYANVDFVQADMTTHQFPKQSLDVIVSSLGFRYLDNKQLARTLNNLHTSLRPGGTLFFIEGHPMRSSQDHPQGYYARGWSKEETPWGTTNPFFNRPLEDFLNITIRAGFKITAFDELQVSDEGKIDPERYQKRIMTPSRFAIKAKK